MKKDFVTFFCSLCFLASPGWSVPVVLQDNLATGDARAGWTVWNSSFGWFTAASGFSTGGIPVSFTSAELMLGLIDGDATGLTGLSLQLTADSAGNPGAVLANLTPTSNLAAFGTGTTTVFTPGGLIVLDPNTPYWIVATNIDGGASSYAWSESTGATQPFRSSSNGGSTWSVKSPPGAMRIVADTSIAAAPEMNSRSAPLPILVVALALGIYSQRRARSLVSCPLCSSARSS